MGVICLYNSCSLRMCIPQQALAIAFNTTYEYFGSEWVVFATGITGCFSYPATRISHLYPSCFSQFTGKKRQDLLPTACTWYTFTPVFQHFAKECIITWKSVCIKGTNLCNFRLLDFGHVPGIGCSSPPTLCTSDWAEAPWERWTKQWGRRSYEPSTRTIREYTRYM